MFKTPTLAVNHEKQEWFRLIDGWPAHIAILIGAVPAELGIADPLIGSWRGHALEFITGGLRKPSRAREEVTALAALAGKPPVTMYKRVQLDYKHIGCTLGKLIVKHPALQDFCFRQMTLPPHYRWLSKREVVYLGRRTHAYLGEKFREEYWNWLESQRARPAKGRSG